MGQCGQTMHMYRQNNEPVRSMLAVILPVTRRPPVNLLNITAGHSVEKLVDRPTPERGRASRLQTTLAWLW